MQHVHSGSVSNFQIYIVPVHRRTGLAYVIGGRDIGTGGRAAGDPRGAGHGEPIAGP